jgi:hypothetical protein
MNVATSLWNYIIVSVVYLIGVDLKHKHLKNNFTIWWPCTSACSCIHIIRHQTWCRMCLLLFCSNPDKLKLSLCLIKHDTMKMFPYDSQVPCCEDIAYWCPVTYISTLRSYSWCHSQVEMSYEHWSNFQQLQRHGYLKCSIWKQVWTCS